MSIYYDKDKIKQILNKSSLTIYNVIFDSDFYNTLNIIIDCEDKISPTNKYGLGPLKIELVMTLENGLIEFKYLDFIEENMLKYSDLSIEDELKYTKSNPKEVAESFNIDVTDISDYIYSLEYLVDCDVVSDLQEYSNRLGIKSIEDNEGYIFCTLTIDDEEFEELNICYNISEGINKGNFEFFYDNTKYGNGYKHSNIKSMFKGVYDKLNEEMDEQDCSIYKLGYDVSIVALYNVLEDVE